MKKYLHILLSGILSGMLITIGATVYLSMLAWGAGDYFFKILGSLFFGVGLFSIIQFGTWLYTGKVGFTLDNKPKYLIDLLVCLLGNFVGAVLLALLLGLTKYGSFLQYTALSLVEAKQADDPLSIFILSFACGIMIYLAVKGHAVCPYSVGKLTLCFLSVSVFILCGFEHVVANASYYAFAKFFDLKALGYFAIMTVGNGLGSICFDGLIKLTNKLKDEKKSVA